MPLKRAKSTDYPKVLSLLCKMKIRKNKVFGDEEEEEITYGMDIISSETQNENPNLPIFTFYILFPHLYTTQPRFISQHSLI
jgi:hypothetical protein